MESAQPAVDAGVTVAAVTYSDCRAEFQTGWGLPAYITWITLSIYVLPIVVLVCVYSRICLAVWRSDRFNRAVSRAARRPSPAELEPCAPAPAAAAAAAGRPRRARSERGPTWTTVSAAKLKTVKLTLVVVVSYMVCYGPWFVVQMWAAWDEEHAPYEGSCRLSVPLVFHTFNAILPFTGNARFDVFRPRRTYRVIAEAPCSYRPSSLVVPSVCPLVMSVYCGKTSNSIEMFRVVARRPKERCIVCGPDTPHQKGQFGGNRAAQSDV